MWLVCIVLPVLFWLAIYLFQTLPQCNTCGLVNANLSAPLCNKCCNHYCTKIYPFWHIRGWPAYAASLTTLPRDVLAIPGVLEQLDLRVQNLNQHGAILASDVLRQASSFQQVASNTRLGHSRIPNKNLVKANTASAAIRQERKDKKDGYGKVTIKLSATLWQLPTPVREGVPRGKMQLVRVPSLMHVPCVLSLILRRYLKYVIRLSSHPINQHVIYLMSYWVAVKLTSVVNMQIPTTLTGTIL